MTCPYHLNLPSLIFIPNCSTLTVPLMYSFLILSFLVTPIAILNIFISATSISSTCFFVTTTISSPYTIAGLTTELYTFPFTLAGNLLSQITYFTPFVPSCLHFPLYFPLTTTTFLCHCSQILKFLYSWHFFVLYLHYFVIISFIYAQIFSL